MRMKKMAATEEGEVRRRRPKNLTVPLQDGTLHTNDAQSKSVFCMGNAPSMPSGNQAHRDEWASNTEQHRLRTAHDYAMTVQHWLWNYQMWQLFNWAYTRPMPFYTMSAFPQHPGHYQQQSTNSANVAQGDAPPGDALGVGQVAEQIQDQGQANGDHAVQGVLFKIPSLWKRVAAEFIDFFVLFLIKLAVTILTVEYVGIVDIQKYDIDIVLNQKLDYNTAFAMTSELIAMEVINRIFICIFETLCLRRGVAGTIGGTTPGKSMMGLRVVSCEQVFSGPDVQTVRVLPAGDIGLCNALVRAVLKNFSLAFFFPVCFTVFFFQHNRAAYDVISNCIVVELT